jgi:hypothetical protein
MARKHDSIGQVRGFLHGLGSALGDISAVRKGKIGRRLARRVAGKANGRLLGRLLR